MTKRSRSETEAEQTLLVAVGSTNPVKIRSVQAAFSSVFPSHCIQVQTMQVCSGVDKQPWGDRMTKFGAMTRAILVESMCHRVGNDGPTFCVGIEGGVTDLHDIDGLMQNKVILESFAWIAVRHVSGQWGISRTASCPLPPQVQQLMRSGMELGEAIDKIFMLTDSKKTGGAVGALTHGRIQRSGSYEQAIVLALAPFMNTELYDIAEIVGQTTSMRPSVYSRVALVCSTSGQCYALPGVGEQHNYTIPTQIYNIQDIIGKELYLLEQADAQGVFRLSCKSPRSNEIVRSALPVSGIAGAGGVQVYGSLNAVANEKGQVSVVFGETSERSTHDISNCNEGSKIDTLSTGEHPWY